MKDRSLKERLRRARRAATPSPNPLKYDPSRTLALRRQFSLRLRGQFARLRSEVLRKIGEEDALGLLTPKMVHNCQPGQMRGADGKCGPGISLGLSREGMPQILKGDTDRLINWLRAQGVGVASTRIAVGALSPVQAEFRQERVDAIGDDALSQPVLTSRDDYILDGTHRWVKAWQRDRGYSLPILKVDLPVGDALDYLRRFPGAKYVSNRRLSEVELEAAWGQLGMVVMDPDSLQPLLNYDPDEARDQAGRWSSSEGAISRAPDREESKGKVINTMRGLLQKGLDALDEHALGAGSMLLNGITFRSPKLVLAAASRMVGSVYENVHQEVYENAMAEHSFGGAHLVGKVAGNLAAKVEDALVGGIRKAIGKLTRNAALILGDGDKVVLHAVVKSVMAQLIDDLHQRGVDVSGFPHADDLLPRVEARLLGGGSTTNAGWRTLKGGQHVWITDAGEVMTGGPPGEKTATGEGGSNPAGHSQEVIKALHDVEPSLVGMKLERGLFIDASGKTIADVTGSETAVTFDKETVLKSGTPRVFTHSHGDEDVSFSENDIYNAKAYGLIETRAVAIKHTYSMIAPDGKWPSVKDIKEIGRIRGEIIGEISIRAGKVRAERGLPATKEAVAKVKAELFDEAYHDRMARWAERHDLVYARVRRGPAPTQKPIGNAAEWGDYSQRVKLELFQAWLRSQLLSMIAGKTQEQLWDQFIRAGYAKGTSRAWDDLKPYAMRYAQDQSTDDFYQGGKAQFLESAFGQKVAKERLDVITSRSFDELEGLTSDMVNKLSRVLVDGLMEGASPREVAQELAEQIDVSEQRAEVIARTELIRAHAEGQLTGMEVLGVEVVGVAVEWSTAGDDRVCPLCQPLEGVVLRIEEARNMIPHHPNCRCAWIPANVGELNESQIRSKDEIEAAFDEAGDGSKEVDEDRPKPI